MDEHTVHFRPPLWLPIIVAVVLGGLYVAGKQIEARGYQSTTISVTGEGKIYATPDIAQMSFGVQTGRQESAESAMEFLNTRMADIVAAVKKAGVEEKDITTQSLWLNPAYDWQEGKQIPRGFEASQNVSVKVRDLDTIGAVLNAAIKQGANQVDQVSFTIDDPNVLQAEARAKAIDDAQMKAEVLADQLGTTLGDLKGFSEGGGGYPVPMYKMDSMAVGRADEAVMPTLPAGQQEVTVQVTLTYEVK